MPMAAAASPGEDARGEQLVETTQARWHRCRWPGAPRACPGDRQTAYQVQAARTVRDLKQGDLIWETGRVRGSRQRVSFDGELSSRDTVAWRIRVWDADRRRPA